ncbi:MAG: 1-acyl-sn-glycerol-3-phosphate acyltransferase [Gammaproteobacteria bacterium]|jgi:1-acyl-sn-glycerol-3-phosphate acyltransferase|nr:1-acyl-sn-glycerol-3-phosphate acyltransferase [Gammaproteobacteria bacterium]
MTDAYADIRPYNDDEVTAVVDGLLHNHELLDAITRYKFPTLHRLFGFALRPLVRIAITRELRNVKDISSWQLVVAKYMQRMINTSIDHLTYSGIEHLESDNAYLFISNHRDIAMDPALVNWGLYTHNLETVRIALGDNLLKKTYVSDIMRLNKSFVVKRSATGVREKMKAYMDLSSYIDESVHTGHNIWIAQREGRAKDGIDASDPAVMKMLYMCKKKSGQSYAEYVDSLHIVPVSISYQYDPCDKAKARELAAVAEGGNYTKGEFEDISSIVKGIIGHKGNVHVAFGEPLRGGVATPEELVTWLDASIANNYQVHDTNVAAMAMQQGEHHAAANKLEARMAELDQAQRKQFLAMYANPLLNQQKFKEED